jgi:hypothetical protein
MVFVTMNRDAPNIGMLSTLFGAIMLQTQSVSDAIDEAITDAIDYLPVVVGALVILVVGYVIGRFLGGVVTRAVRRLGVDRYASGTAFEGAGEGDAIARALGKLVSYYVYFVAALAAANVLDIPELSELLADLGSFLPVILGAVVVLVIGFDVVGSSETSSVISSAASGSARTSATRPSSSSATAAASSAASSARWSPTTSTC